MPVTSSPLWRGRSTNSLTSFITVPKAGVAAKASSPHWSGQGRASTVRHMHVCRVMIRCTLFLFFREGVMSARAAVCGPRRVLSGNGAHFLLLRSRLRVAAGGAGAARRRGFRAAERDVDNYPALRGVDVHACVRTSLCIFSDEARRPQVSTLCRSSMLSGSVGGVRAVDR